MKPILNLLEINSLLYEGMPGVTRTKNLRDRGAAVFESVLEVDAQSSLLIAVESLDKRLHLMVPSEFFSLEDLIGITTGETQQLLKAYASRLCKISPESFDRGTEDDVEDVASVTGAIGGISVKSFIKSVSDIFLA